jgi:hypothetical protein
VTGRVFVRALYPVIVVTAATLAAVTIPVTALLYQALRDVPSGVDPMAGIVRSTILAAIVAALAAPPALAFARRTSVEEAERVDW